MKKYLVLVMFMCGFMFARVDYSEMSNQELIAIMGYVKEENKKDFEKELKSRIPSLSQKEKEEYEKNLNENKVKKDEK